MPITAWYCRECGGREVPLDHFATTDCGLLINEDYPAAVLHSERSHYRHGRRVIGSTDILGCPRAAAIKHEVEYAVDPVTLMAPERGTAWHGHIEKVAMCPDVEVDVTGFLAGVQVETRVDRLDKGRGVIRDWKTQNDYAARDGKIKPEHEAQVSIGAELTAQTLGWRPELGIIDYAYNVKPHLRAHRFVPWGVERVLAFKPLEGPSTVLDHLHLMDRWVRGAVKWQDMPLTGFDQKIGKDGNSCDWCSVAGICKTQAKGAAF